MNKMFYDCYLLKELNIYNFNTTNVEDMSSMFYGCSAYFNTSNVKNMNSMFRRCVSLRELNLSNFIFDKVKYMRNMFFSCVSLKNLNISNFNTGSINSFKFDGMFSECSDELKIKIRTQNKNIPEKAFI